MYVPFAQHYEPIVRLVARASGDAGMLVGTLRQVTNLVAPDLGITDAATGLAVTGSANVPVKIMASVAGLLGLLALVLAMAGLYGVLSYVVTRRTREMGVRVALGATPGRVMRLVFRDGMWPVLEGLVIGLTLADLTGMALRPVFVRILPSIDPLMYTVVPVPFLVAACLACYLPARRAAAADPNVALRQL
jgi:ABC-type antimicrobial peptide transport system permease subunit